MANTAELAEGAEDLELPISAVDGTYHDWNEANTRFHILDKVIRCLGWGMVACTCLPWVEANIGPKRSTHVLTVPRQISIPRWCKRSYTFRSLSGYFTYIITTSRMISGKS